MNWKAIIEEQASSGQSVVGFCRERGIRANNFYNWRLKLGRSEEKFARVVTQEKIVIELQSGAVIRVMAEDLKVVLAAL